MHFSILNLITVNSSVIIAADGEVEYTFTVPTNGKYCIYTDVAGVYVDAYTSKR